MHNNDDVIASESHAHVVLKYGYHCVTSMDDITISSNDVTTSWQWRVRCVSSMAYLRIAILGVGSWVGHFTTKLCNSWACMCRQMAWYIEVIIGPGNGLVAAKSHQAITWTKIDFSELNSSQSLVVFYSKYISFSKMHIKIPSKWLHLGSALNFSWLRHQIGKYFPRHWSFFRGIHQWIPITKAGDAELWCFLWSTPEQTVE